MSATEKSLFLKNQNFLTFKKQIVTNIVRSLNLKVLKDFALKICNRLYGAKFAEFAVVNGAICRSCHKNNFSINTSM
jgi:hypothetical protein